MRFSLVPRTVSFFLLCALVGACEQPAGPVQPSEETGPVAPDKSAPGVQMSRLVASVPETHVDGEVEATLTDSVGVVRVTYQVNRGAEQPVAVDPGRSVHVRFRAPLTGTATEVTVYAYDAAGNRGEGKTWVLRDDGAAPQVSVREPRADTVSTRSQRFAVLATDATGIAEMTLAINSAEPVPMKHECLGNPVDLYPCGKQGELRGWTASLAALAPGSNTLRLRARDNVGHDTTVTRTLNLVPAVSVLSPTASSVVEGDSVRVVGSAFFVEPVARVGIQVNAGPTRTVSVAPSTSVTFELNAALEDAGNVITVHAYDAAGNSGRGAVAVVRSARAAASGPWASAGAGWRHSCALTKSGAAYCWGDNTSGQLGTGDRGVRTAPAQVAGGHTFASLSVGALHTCGITAGGATLCWGDNEYGQLGNGGAADAVIPTAVSGASAFTKVVAASTFSCGLAPSGAVYCWGRGEAVGSQAPVCSSSGFSAPCSATPVLASADVRFRAISATSGHVCGVTAGDAAYCWGNNQFGSVGDATKTHSRAPTAVHGGLTFRSVSAGSTASCGVTTAGKGYCWGANLYGELGTGGVTAQLVPTAVASNRTWMSVETGGGFTCGVDETEQGYCWGNNYPSHQLGRGKIDQQSWGTPGPVLGGISFVSLALGNSHACGVSRGGALYCWGAGENGQLGYGQRTSSGFPVRVTGL